MSTKPIIILSTILSSSALVMSIGAILIASDIFISYPKATTPEDAIKLIYSTKPKKSALSELIDYNLFWHRHWEEINRTFEVSSVETNDDMAIAFVRYSIGSDIYRKTHWLRKVEGQWTQPLGGYVSEYSNKRLLKGKEEWFKLVKKKGQAWEKGSYNNAWWHRNWLYYDGCLDDE